MNEIDKTVVATAFKCRTDELSILMPVRVSDFVIVSQNIRSVYANLADFQLNLCALKTKVDLIILTECRLHIDKHIPQMNDFKAFNTTKHLNQADGVVAYIRDTYEASITEICLTHASCLQITTSDLTIIGIYRSPSVRNADDFINSLNSHLSSISNCRNVIITGDININLIFTPEETAQERSNRTNYLNMLAMHGMLPGHSLPTREENCLDHFILKFCNGYKSASIAVIDSSITDHSTILLKISNLKINNKCKTKITTNYEEALKTLKTTDLSKLLTVNDPNSVVEQLTLTIQQCLQSNMKETSVPRKNRIIKPWITLGALRCIKNRNDMQRKVKLNPENEILKITYKRYRNFCNCLIKKLKREYDRKQLELAIRNPKKLWQTIDSLTQRKPAKVQSLDLLKLTLSPQESADTVNSYFATIGQQLAEDIIKSRTRQATDAHNITNTQVSSLAILDTDREEIYSLLMSMKSDSAPGYDNIPAHFLKSAHNEVIPILVHLANLCFKLGVFPSVLKQAIITPIYKGGDKTNPSNYRPISVISVMAKILEKLINVRLINFFSKYNTLSTSQFGFRQNLSTEDAIIALTSLTVNHVDSGRKCLAVFLDLKKAFDTVSVPILVQNLHNVGVRGIPLKLLSDYLSNRKTRVKIGSIISSESTVTYGVPQGSVLGPTLFLAYINGLCGLQIEGGDIFSYADDTAIVFSADDWEQLKNRVETGLVKIASWLNKNLLTLNVLKTNYICFTKYNNTQPPDNFKIKLHYCDNHLVSDCSCTELKKVFNARYLGVMLDQRLSWNHHIELLIGRVRKLIWTFKTLRHIARMGLLHKIYFALAESVITYCISVWGGATKTSFLNLERAQRALLKVMFFLPYRFPTDSLYLTSGILSVRRLYLLRIVTRKHKSISYDPRKTNRRTIVNVVSQPRVKSVFAKRQFVSQSAYIYNTLNKKLNFYPLAYIECKNRLKTWLITTTYEEIESMIHHS